LDLKEKGIVKWKVVEIEIKLMSQNLCKLKREAI
jgi:hypothetical protein